MGQEWPVLTYPGDLSDEDRSGILLGFDETYRPYEVLDIEIWPRDVPDHVDPYRCPTCQREDLHSHVYLGYATGDTVKAKQADYQLQLAAEALRQQAFERDFLTHFGRRRG